jgi:aspartate-semialdehyde dehydrogenase
MPSFERESHRIVIAGASSLLGAELKSLLEESKFAASDFRLLDEEEAAGTLTEAGGEAAVIRPVEEGSFDRARLVFFTGSPQFTQANLVAANAAHATIVDLSGRMAELPVKHPKTEEWFPRLEMLRGVATPKDTAIYAIPSAAGTAISALALALASVGLKGLVVTCFQPVSEAGRAGIEELESQTSQLLSFQNVGTPVFDAQIAFSLLDRFGGETSRPLAEARKRIRAEVKACVAAKVPRPAVQVVHAPVFYGTLFSAWAHIDRGANCESILEACQNAGFFITAEHQGPSNVSVAGENVIQLAVPEPDPAQVGSWWFWGAADNIRLPAWNAVKLAEKVLP